MKNFLSPNLARCGHLGTMLLLGSTLFLLTLGSAVAQDAPFQAAGVTKLSDFHYRVWACNPKAVHGSVRLLATGGKTLYDQYSANVNFGQSFDLSQLPEGNYEFLVTVAGEPHRFPLTVQTVAAHPERVAQVSTELAQPNQLMVSMTTRHRRGGR